MSWAQFLRREWGAATFVLTVLVGLVAVPIALYLGNQSAQPISVPAPIATPTVATGATTATPARTPSPTPS